MSSDAPTPPPLSPGSPSSTPPPGHPPHAKKRIHGCLIAAIIAGAVLIISIPIVALLAGIAFPSYSAIMKKMKDDQARTLALSIVNSCKAYYAEYSKFPLPADGTAGEVSPLRTDEILTGTLLGTLVEQNPKKMSFLPELKAVERGGGFGLLSEGDTAIIVDPWGEEYYVLMDADYSGTIENPNAASTTTTLHQGVIVFSAGPDKDPSTWSDNVMSWDSRKRNP